MIRGHLAQLDGTVSSSVHLRAVLLAAVIAGGDDDANVDRMTDRQVAAAALDVALFLVRDLAKARGVSMDALVDSLLATSPAFDILGR